MNNRYIFRGKGNPKYNDGEWYYGHLIYDGSDYQIVDPEYGSCRRTVIAETIGQCTELTDKNGKLIFEGDIVKDTQSGICYFIKWFSECACYSLANRNGEINFGCDELEIFLDDLSVIGNVHDDDLLEVER